MADADTNDTSSTASQNSVGDRVQSELAKVNEQMEAMNRQFQEQFQTLANAVRKPEPTVETVSDDDIYEPAKLKEKILKEASRMTADTINEQRAKDLMIYNLAQEYPEIQTSTELRKAVLDAQANLPKNIQNTAEGYEMAVLKSVSKAGLIPKSKRKSIDDDISFGGGSGSTNRRQPTKKKVTDNMVQLARLLGRNTDDPKVMEGLEQAANRDSWSKYR